MLIIEMIEPGQMRGVLYSVDRGINSVLLPVKPPELNALLFNGKKRVAKKCVHIITVARIEAEILHGTVQICLLSVRLKSFVEGHLFGISLIEKLLYKLRIVGIVVAKAVCGVIVEHYLDALFVELIYKLVGVGNKCAVPGISRPAQILACVAVSKEGIWLTLVVAPVLIVPVHIHDHSIKGDVVFLILTHKAEKFIRAVFPPAGVP